MFLSHLVLVQDTTARTPVKAGLTSWRLLYQEAKELWNGRHAPKIYFNNFWGRLFMALAWEKFIFTLRHLKHGFTPHDTYSKSFKTLRLVLTEPFLCRNNNSDFLVLGPVLMNQGWLRACFRSPTRLWTISPMTVYTNPKGSHFGDPCSNTVWLHLNSKAALV